MLTVVNAEPPFNRPVHTTWPVATSRRWSPDTACGPT